MLKNLLCRCSPLLQYTRRRETVLLWKGFVRKAPWIGREIATDCNLPRVRLDRTLQQQKPGLMLMICMYSCRWKVRWSIHVKVIDSGYYQTLK